MAVHKILANASMQIIDSLQCRRVELDNLQASSFETETAGDYCHGGPHRRNGVPIDMDGSRDACAAVIAGPRVGEHLTSHHGRPERVVEFAIPEQTGIGRDDGSTKLKHQSAVDKRA